METVGTRTDTEQEEREEEVGRKRKKKRVRVHSVVMTYKVFRGDLYILRFKTRLTQELRPKV